MGEFDEAIARGRDAVRVAESVDHAYSVAVAHWGLAYAYVQRGELDSAVRLLESTLALCRDWTIPILLQISTGLYGIALVRSGKVAEGISTLREAERSVLEGLGTGNYNTLHVLWLGEACARGGRYQDALETADRALALSRQFNHAVFEGWVLRLLGEIALESEPHRLAIAEDHLQQTLMLGQKLGMRPLIARCHADLARLYRRSDRGTEADQHFRTATEMYQEMGMKYGLEQLEPREATT